MKKALKNKKIATILRWSVWFSKSITMYSTKWFMETFELKNSNVTRVVSTVPIFYSINYIPLFKNIIQLNLWYQNNKESETPNETSNKNFFMTKVTYRHILEPTLRWWIGCHKTIYLPTHTQNCLSLMPVITAKRKLLIGESRLSWFP